MYRGFGCGSMHRSPQGIRDREGGQSGTYDPGVGSASANFERLILGCIKADYCNQIVGKYVHSTFFEMYRIFSFVHRCKLKQVVNLTKC